MGDTKTGFACRGAVRAIIFDLDGTLVDSRSAIVGILNDMLAHRGSQRRIDPLLASPHLSSGGRHLVSSLLGKESTDPESDLADFRLRYAARPTSPAELYDGVLAGVNTLYATGYRLAICSNKPQVLCEKVLADTGLAPFFNLVVGGRADLVPKPAPNMLAAAVDGLGCTKDQCLYVGDSDVDHEAALAYGVPFCFVSYGYAAEGWSPGDCCRFDTFADLLEEIRAGGAYHG